MFDNKEILITGGTGSFGSNFVKFLLSNFNPKRLIIFSRDELKQFELEQELLEHSKFKCLRFFLGDVRDKERLEVAMRGVEYVIHSAAIKQVVASEYNPMECIKTNIYGAENVISASIKNEVKKVIALSTDKAESPVNLYGATKLVSDKLFVAANNLVRNDKTKFAIVRYGNVAGSRGSIVPVFQKLIEEGSDALPITDPDMTRFWITLDEGINLVAQSFERMIGGEIFVPKIPSIRITDLASAMAPHCKHKLIGVRPGEKIHEVLCGKENAHLTIEFDDHYVITPSIKFSDDKYFLKNAKGETGEYVEKNFEYSSGNNERFLSQKEILEYNKK